MNPITLKIEGQDLIFRYIPAPRGNKYRLIRYTFPAVGDVKPFYMADTPICDGDFPKAMSWNDGIALCKNLTDFKKEFDSYTEYQKAVDSSALFLRLPTEYEWEWAALGGEYFEYAGCTNDDKVAWPMNNINSMKHEVKRKKPNGYGLYDMSGNGIEWTANWCNDDVAPTPQNTGPFRVVRGDYALVASRAPLEPGRRRNYLGVRLCFSANPIVLSKLQQKGLI